VLIIITVPSSLKTSDNSGASTDLHVPTKRLEDAALPEEAELDDELEVGEDELPVLVPLVELSDLLQPAKSRENIKARPRQTWSDSALFITYLLEAD
jgi:hypothetical protein